MLADRGRVPARHSAAVQPGRDGPGIMAGAGMTDLRPAPTPASVTVRPLRPADAADAAACGRISLEQLYPEDLSPEELAIRIASGTRRVAHLQHTDPGGCWVADCDGRVVGAAVGLIREGMWGLSLFALLPGYQGRGIGNRLYAPALAYGAGQPGAIILSSSHPAAIRRYARSPGFALVPTVGLTGIVDPARVPATLRCRAGDLAADAATIEAASRHVRGASHLRDLPLHVDRPGMTLLVVEGEGFVCAHHGSPTLLAARTPEAAEDLLWGAITSGAPGATVSYDFVTAQNQWAIRTGLQAGLAVTGCGPLFVRGRLGPLAPYLPSGAYL
jgi:GNAT superfamily N-acetyltransferase